MSPSRRRAVAVVSLATPLFAAWVAGPALLPGADVTPAHVAIGLVGTYGMGGLGLALSHRQSVRLVDHRQRHVPQPERQRRSEVSR